MSMPQSAGARPSRPQPAGRPRAGRLAATLTLLCAAALAQAQTPAQPPALVAGVLEFDSFSRIAGGTPYGGFTWGDRWWQTLADPGQPLTFDNNPGSSSLIRRTDRSAFVFDGATFWKRGLDKNIDVTVQLFNAQGVSVWTSTFEINPFIDIHGVDGRLQLTSGYTSPIAAMTVFVDQGTVNGGDRNYLAMDTFRFQATAAAVGLPNVPEVAAAVPEPHTTAMLLAGVGVFGLMARRRRSAGVRAHPI